MTIVSRLLKSWARPPANWPTPVRQGRVLLWARLVLPGQEQSTCETLLNAHPLRVEVHDLVPVSPPILSPKVANR